MNKTQKLLTAVHLTLSLLLLGLFTDMVRLAWMVRNRDVERWWEVPWKHSLESIGLLWFMCVPIGCLWLCVTWVAFTNGPRRGRWLYLSPLMAYAASALYAWPYL